MSTQIWFLALFCLSLAACGGGSGATPAVSQVELTNAQESAYLRFDVEIASDEVARRTGLMGHAALDSMHGLLIVLPAEGETCITNQGVGFAIDAVFADSTGQVVAVDSNITAGDPTLRCHTAVRSILEVGGGEASAIQIGDHLLEL
ncbi:MAG TPA: DUF192 domain-containing protein [Candidatus Acidoferrales bacterium]|nr:DUF192 domain-containing protein [Candidatus Acidoferrales bacterium]